MSRYAVFLNTTLSVRVEVNAADEEEVQEAAWQQAQEFVDTIFRDDRGLTANASFDGIGADEVVELDS